MSQDWGQAEGVFCGQSRVGCGQPAAAHTSSHTAPTCCVMQLGGLLENGKSCSRQTAVGSPDLHSRPNRPGPLSLHRGHAADQVSLGPPASDQQRSYKSEETAYDYSSAMQTCFYQQRKKKLENKKKREKKHLTKARKGPPESASELLGPMLTPCSLVTTQECTPNCTMLLEGSRPGSREVITGTH